MKTKLNPFQWKPLVLLIGAVFSTSAFGAGFQISEQSLTGLGRAFAGAGVAGDDASDMFYNPAALTMSDMRTFQLGGTFISSSGKIKNQGSFQGVTDLGTGATFAVPSQGPDADGGTDAFVPNIYYAFPRSGDLRYGVSISAPFGLKTDYAKDWVGRYHALTSELKTIDINPSVGYAVSPTLSIGGGVSAQYGDATLTQALFLGPTTPDGNATVTGDDWGFGYNFGVMYQPTNDSRVGLGFRSKIKQSIDGKLKITLPGDIRLPSTGASATVDLPETIYLSGMTRLNSKTSLLGSIRWTNWSRFDELRVKFDNGSPDSVTDESWDDATMISLGVNYELDPAWTLRFGYAHDESPVVDATHRTPRIPDADRDWVTIGASYRPAANMSVDFGYAHLFIDKSDIINTIPIGLTSTSLITDTLIGEIRSASADLLGVQFLMTF